MTNLRKPVLETKRLCLREFVEEDAPAFFELNSNPEVIRFTGDVCLTSVEQARTGLLERPLLDYRKFGFGRWAVVLKQNAKLIGFAGLKYLDDLCEVDIGYRLLPDYWGLGLATEAARACVQYGLQTLELRRILGLVDLANLRSVRVLEKSGLIFDKMIEYRSQQVAQYIIESHDATIEHLKQAVEFAAQQVSAAKAVYQTGSIEIERVFEAENAKADAELTLLRIRAAFSAMGHEVKDEE